MINENRGSKMEFHLNESGQGVVEYILVLCIAVMLIGSFIYQFSSAFRQYANNYFGDYVMCLMESGDLPGTPNNPCSDLWTGFDIKNGTTSTGGSVMNGGGVGSGNGNSSGSNGDGTSGSKSGKSNTSGNKSSSNSSGGGGSSSRGGETVAVSGDSGSGGNGYNSKSGRNASTPVNNDGDKNGGGKGRAGLRPVGSIGSSTSDSGGGGRGRRYALDGSYGYAGQEEDKTRAEDRPVSKAVAKNDADHLRPPKAVEAAPRGPAAVKDDGGGGFSLGNFIRIMLIAGIIIAIFILFGGQLLAISKSGEK